MFGVLYEGVILGKSAMDDIESRELMDKIGVLEDQIEILKKQLNDTTLIDALTRRIANCENLAGISNIKNE